MLREMANTLLLKGIYLERKVQLSYYIILWCVLKETSIQRESKIFLIRHITSYYLVEYHGEIPCHFHKVGNMFF